MKTKFKETLRMALIIFVVLFGATLAQAQGHEKQDRQPGPPPLPSDEQIEKMVSDLSATLSLSKKQEKEVADLYFAHFEELEARREKEQAEREDKRKEMEAFRSGFETEVKSVLTEDQQKEYDAYLKKMKSERPGKGKPMK